MPTPQPSQVASRSHRRSASPYLLCCSPRPNAQTCIIELSGMDSLQDSILPEWACFSPSRQTSTPPPPPVTTGLVGRAVPTDASAVLVTGRITIPSGRHPISWRPIAARGGALLRDAPFAAHFAVLVAAAARRGPTSAAAAAGDGCAHSRSVWWRRGA